MSTYWISQVQWEPKQTSAGLVNMFKSVKDQLKKKKQKKAKKKKRWDKRMLFSGFWLNLFSFAPH